LASINGEIIGLAPSPEFRRDGICFAAHHSGLLKTDDHGTSWQSLYSAFAPEFGSFSSTAVAVSASFVRAGTVLAAIPGGIGRSDDAGKTWRFSRLQLPPPLITSLALSPDFEHDGRAFAGSLQDGVLKTDDGGASWHAWNAGLIDREVLSLAISPRFPMNQTVFAGTGTGVFGSRNAGRSWQPRDIPVGDSAILCLAVRENGVVFGGTEDAGLWRSLDHGEHWHRVGRDLLPEEIRSVVLVMAQGLVVIGEGIVVQSDDDGDTWTELAGENDPFIAILKAQV
jgi:photosystem II stability/assembly factor-like uncharacterized protein